MALIAMMMVGYVATFRNTIDAYLGALDIVLGGGTDNDDGTSANLMTLLLRPSQQQQTEASATTVITFVEFAAAWLSPMFTSRLGTGGARGTVRLVTLITRLTISISLPLSMATLLGVWVLIARKFRADVLLARRRGWRATLAIQPTSRSQFPVFQAANYVGFQVASMAVSTLLIAFLIALVCTPFVLLALGVFNLGQLFGRDALLAVFGPLLVLRLVLLLLAKFFVTHRHDGTISRLRPFVLIEFVLLFLNVISGWVLVLTRLASSLVRLFVLFARVDIPAASDHASDPGFVAYVAAVRIQTGVHRNPVAVVAARALIEVSRSRFKPVRMSKAVPRLGFGATVWRMVPTEGDPAQVERARRRRVLRNRWWIAITLAHNPRLIPVRKGALVASAGETASGVEIEMQDMI
jgi:hypothetical protein